MFITILDVETLSQHNKQSSANNIMAYRQQYIRVTRYIYLTLQSSFFCCKLQAHFSALNLNRAHFTQTNLYLLSRIYFVSNSRTMFISSQPLTFKVAISELIQGINLILILASYYVYMHYV